MESEQLTGLPPAHSDEGTLGVALRQARKAHGLSLAEVASRTGISRSLLSLIETGQSDITIGRLSRLAHLYDLRLADLVPETRSADPIVVRSGEGRSMRYVGEGVAIEILVPDGPHGMQALLSTFEPQVRMTDFVRQPNEQFVHVLEGRIRTELADGREFELGPGDSATFVSGEGGHRHANLVDEAARMLIVIRRPSAR